MQGTGVWYFNAQVISSLFVQFVRIQRVMPPVPGELCFAATSVQRLGLYGFRGCKGLQPSRSGSILGTLIKSWRAPVEQALFCRDNVRRLGPYGFRGCKGLQPSRSREAHWSFDQDLEGVRSLGAALVDASLFGRKGMSERAKNLEGEAVAPPGASRMPSKGLCSPR